MTTTRLEAFSDGVIAIIITIMVLEMKVPHDTSWNAIKGLIPVFNSYLLSFIFVGIYWGNHHHLLHATRQVSWKIIWANMHLLFWLSLIPFATGWMGENHFVRNTVIIYGAVLFGTAIAFTILQVIIQKGHHKASEMSLAFQKLAKKGIFSLIGYVAAIGLSFVHTGISLAILVIVAITWLIPDRNIEKAVAHNELSS